ncbi:MAG: AAA family ATPase [Deltaproteobacteria bacterium]|nr:AAA family ATPase [Deltaproteobacteria bacterium]
MYRAFFGFREKPFNLTPDPKFLYLNASYREALAALHYGVVDRKGFVSLIGEAGTGKTTLLRRLLSELPRETRSVLVINPAIGFEEMLRFILSDLGRPPAPGATKLDMLEALNAELLTTLARGGNVVVLIDEAQDLTIPVLEELRLLSNLETAKEKILQLVLAGQPEFDALLARPEIRQLRQRISVSARLRPLGRSEVKAYVAARIAAAGGDVRGLFTSAALLRLWWFSGGVPRLVNAACDNALVTAYARGKRTIGWREIGEAMRDLRRQVTWAPSRMGRAAALLTAAVLGGALAGGGLMVARGGGRTFAPRVASATVVAATATPRPSGTPQMPAAAAVEPAATGTSEPTSSPTPSGTSTATPTLAATPTPGETPRRVEEARAQSTRVPQTGDLRVTVSGGDTITDLAVRYYGSAAPRVLAAIKAANPWLDNPNVIAAGRTLVLPGPRMTDGAPPVAAGGFPIEEGPGLDDEASPPDDPPGLDDDAFP